MKNIIALLLIAVMAISLAACGGNTDDPIVTKDTIGTKGPIGTTNPSVTQGNNPNPGTNPSTPGVNQGGPQQGNENWFTNEQLSALGIAGLSAPNAAYSIYHYPNAKMGGISFTNGTVSAFDDYANVLYNNGFNKSFMNDVYTDFASINDALVGTESNRAFTACKYVPGSYRVEIFGNHIDAGGYKDTSFTINFYDLSTRPEKTWFTASEATEMGFTGLDAFANIADKTVVSSKVSTFDPTKQYKISVSGVAKADALALAEYFFGKGANIDHNEENKGSPDHKSSYNDEALFNDYSDSFDFWAEFCTKSNECDVYMTWCKEPYDAGGEALPENLLEIELTWNKNHKVGNH